MDWPTGPTDEINRVKRSSESLAVQIQSQGKDYIKVEDKNDAVSALKPAP